jgi:hypothetical protein
VTPVDRADFVSVPVSGYRSATCNQILPLMKDYHLTRIVNVPLVGFDPFLEEISHDKFRFVINHKTFPTSVIEANALSLTVRG